MRATSPGILMLMTTLNACEQAVTDPAYERYDSAGGEVVVSHRPRVHDASGVVGFPPLLRLGVAAGDEFQEFAVVSDATLLSDGGVAVLDTGNDEVRVFGPEGAFRRSFGREGDGPGEFRFGYSIQAVGGDLAVMDRGLARLTWFSVDGDLLDAQSLKDSVGSFSVLNVAVLDERAMLSIGRIGGPGRVSRSTSVAQVVEFEGEVRLRGEHDHVLFRGAAAEFTQIRGVGVVSPPFPNRVYAAGNGDRAYVGTSDRFEIRVFDLLGVFRRAIRYPAKEQPLRDEEVTGLADSIRRTGGPVHRAAYDPALQPEMRPVFNQLEVSEGGWLWVGRYAYGLGFTRDWWVFAPSGELVAEIELPHPVDILDVSDDRVVWRILGPLGEQRVEVVQVAMPVSGNGFSLTSVSGLLPE